MKKRIFSCLLSLALVLSVVFVITPAARAANSTAYTYVKLASGEWMRTQDAYIPNHVLMQNQNLYQPEDLFLHDGKIYIADTGNKRIVVLDLKTNDISTFGSDILSSPSGIFVTDEGKIYIADKGLAKIFVFDHAYQWLRTYERPTEVTFGSQTQFIPYKITVGPEGIMYVISSGSFDGIIQMDAEGRFLGYFGYNNNPTTLSEWLIDRFFTDEQKQNILNKTPYTFRNLDIDTDDLIYTVTMGAKDNAVKKHDVAGNNLLQDMYDETNFVDLSIGTHGQIYAVTETGLIYEYDGEGNLLFSMGGLAASREMVGLFTKVSAIECDDDGNVYVLDQERGLLHTFSPTSFVTSVHMALDAYNEGHYTESEEIWQSVRRISGSCQMVENGLGNCAFQRQDFETAAYYYKQAENRQGYSDSYWEIRNGQISTLLPWVLAAVVLGAILLAVYRRCVQWRIKRYKPGRRGENLIMVFRTIAHPIDTFESIRWANKGDYLTATLIYILWYVVFVCNYVLRGFVVSTANTQNTSIVFVSLIFFVPVVLFIGCNFLVGEINDSKARFRDLYIGAAYCGAPFIVFIPFVVMISNVVTLNESRILSLVSIAIYVWCVILLIIFLKEVHMYLLRMVFKNLAITIFLMGVAILAASLLGMFADQMLNFIVEIIKEAQLRVT